MANPTIPLRYGALPAAVALFGLSGCYEYEEQPAPAPAQTPVAASAPEQGAASTGQSDAQPSYAGARQAAQNTVDKVEERQRELEKALEDDQ